MLIAEAKKRSNIVEYLLYMYQIEDIIRSFQFDLNVIEKMIIQKYEQPDSIKQAIYCWYEELIQEMREEGIEKTGHLKRLKVVVEELKQLHQSILTTIQNQQYIDQYDLAKPILKELVLKSGGQQLSNEVDVAVNGLYGLLMLRLKKEEIAKETEDAMKLVSGFLAQLAVQYKKLQEGDLGLSLEKNN
jgi:hypothetical protein